MSSANAGNPASRTRGTLSKKSSPIAEAGRGRPAGLSAKVGGSSPRNKSTVRRATSRFFGKEFANWSTNWRESGRGVSGSFVPWRNTWRSCGGSCTSASTAWRWRILSKKCTDRKTSQLRKKAAGDYRELQLPVHQTQPPSLKNAFAECWRFLQGESRADINFDFFARK